MEPWIRTMRSVSYTTLLITIQYCTITYYVTSWLLNYEIFHHEKKNFEEGKAQKKMQLLRECLPVLLAVLVDNGSEIRWLTTICSFEMFVNSLVLEPGPEPSPADG